MVVSQRIIGQTANASTDKPERIARYRFIAVPGPTGDSEAIEFETRLIETDDVLMGRIRRRLNSPSFVSVEEALGERSAP